MVSICTEAQHTTSDVFNTQQQFAVFVGVTWTAIQWTTHHLNHRPAQFPFYGAGQLGHRDGFLWPGGWAQIPDWPFYKFCSLFLFMCHPASDGYPTWLNLFLSVFEGSTPPIRWFFLSRKWSIPFPLEGVDIGLDQQGCRSHIQWSVRWLIGTFPHFARHVRRYSDVLTFEVFKLLFSVAVVCCQHICFSQFSQKPTAAMERLRQTTKATVMNHGDWNFMV